MYITPAYDIHADDKHSYILIHTYQTTDTYMKSYLNLLIFGKARPP